VKIKPEQTEVLSGKLIFPSEQQKHVWRPASPQIEETQLGLTLVKKKCGSKAKRQSNWKAKKVINPILLGGIAEDPPDGGRSVMSASKRLMLLGVLVVVVVGMPSTASAIPTAGPFWQVNGTRLAAGTARPQYVTVIPSHCTSQSEDLNSG
jgi:hypothetical protein